MTGISVIYSNLLQSLFGSLFGSMGIVFVSIFVMFLFLFKSFYLALLGIIPNFLSAGAVIGTIGLVGIPLDVMTVTVAAVSIGMGVDNTIHYIFRFKKEYDSTKDYLLSSKNTHITIGKALLFTSMTIIFGFLSLSMSNFNILDKKVRILWNSSLVLLRRSSYLINNFGTRGNPSFHEI